MRSFDFPKSAPTESKPHHPKHPKKKSVQAYIDETPFWEDGTEVADASMTGMQKRIWTLATAGKFFEGMVVFMTGVAIPLLHQDFGLTAAQKGIVGAAPLFGILIGATVLGGLADVFGRKRMFIVELILFTLFLLGVALSPSYWPFVIFLFGTGAALGCDYPTAHLVISESIPSRSRGKLVLGAFSFQAVGALFGTALGFFILSIYPQSDAWRWMYGSILPLGVIIVFLRFFVPESAHWLVSKHQKEDASKELGKLLNRHPEYPKKIALRMPKKHKDGKSHGGSYAELFKKKNRRATILASVPWFLQDLGTYGIGIFTPTILATMIGAKSGEHNLAAITAWFGIETRGMNLESLEDVEYEDDEGEPAFDPTGPQATQAEAKD